MEIKPRRVRATLASGTAILILPLVLDRLADIAGLKLAFAVIGFLFVVLLVLLFSEVRSSWRSI